jgi:hypothetical protein
MSKRARAVGAVKCFNPPRQLWTYIGTFMTVKDVCVSIHGVCMSTHGCGDWEFFMKRDLSKAYTPTCSHPKPWPEGYGPYWAYRDKLRFDIPAGLEARKRHFDINRHMNSINGIRSQEYQVIEEWNGQSHIVWTSYRKLVYEYHHTPELNIVAVAYWFRRPNGTLFAHT